MAEETNGPHFRQLYMYVAGNLVPVNAAAPGRPPRYPLHKLEKPGDSFFVPGVTHKRLKHLYRRAKGYCMTITMRTVEEEDEKGRLVQGVRVWRKA